MAGKKMQLSVAQKMVSDYSGASRAEDIKSITVDSSCLQNIISQPGCQSVRFFLALENGIPKGPVGLPVGHTLVAIGVDANGKNMKYGEDDTEVYEDFHNCPPVCNDDSYTL